MRTRNPATARSAANDNWLEKLRADRLVLIDGGTGSELQRRGVAMHAAAWSGPAAYAHGNVLRDIHADYIQAGADVITTNTFATTRFVLEAAGLGEAFETINRRAVEAAFQARETGADRPVAIAGSLSCLPPRFDPQAYPEAGRERDGYRELAGLLAEEGVDLIALEMMEEPRHARMVLEAALEVELPVWLGVACRLDPSGAAAVGFDYPDIPLAQTLAALIPLGPTVINVMHTPPDAVSTALASIRAHWTGPLGVYPELGPDRQATQRIPPERLVGYAREWVGGGARLLGGCCGTTPDHIRALRDALPDLHAARNSSARDTSP